MLLALLPAAGCGTEGEAVESRIIGETLTVYSSLPLRGPLAPLSHDLVRAEKLAVLEVGGRIGPFDIGYVSLDSADPSTGRTSLRTVVLNARQAVQTPNTIAYLGELEPGASAVSLPLVNAAGILQITPGDSYAGLTDPAAGAAQLQPSGRRTFARVVPDGDEQARALVALLRAERARRVVVEGGDDRAGRDVARRVRARAREAGMTVVDRVRGADAYAWTGPARRDGFAALRAAARADRSLALVAGDPLAIMPGLRARLGPAARRLALAAVDPAPRSAEGRAFARDFAAQYGVRPHPRALLAYRAMRLVLDGIRRSGDDAQSRRTVNRHALEAVGGIRPGFARFEIRRAGLVRVGPAL